MARKAARGWLTRLILGQYADVLDRAEDLIDSSRLKSAIAESDAAHNREHERLSREIEEVRRMVDATAVEVQTAERALGVG